jgi:hypothetical protein
MQFKDVSSRISRDVTDTQEKLDTLASLVSNRGLYDDNPTEIQGYTKIIKTRLPEHKDEIKVLQQFVASGSSDMGQNQRDHTFFVVKILSAKWAKLSKDFKSVLEMRGANMRKARERRDMFAFGGSAPPLVPDDMPSIFGGTVRVYREKLTPKDAIGSHASSLEASMRVTNGMLLGCSLLLPVGTVNYVQTLKDSLGQGIREATRQWTCRGLRPSRHWR